MGTATRGWGLALALMCAGAGACAPPSARVSAPLDPDVREEVHSTGLIVRLSSDSSAVGFDRVARSVLEQDGALVLRDGDEATPDVRAELAAVSRANGDHLWVTVSLTGEADGRPIPPLAMGYSSLTGEPDEQIVTLLWSAFRRRVHAEAGL